MLRRAASNAATGMSASATPHERMRFSQVNGVPGIRGARRTGRRGVRRDGRGVRRGRVRRAGGVVPGVMRGNSPSVTVGSSGTTGTTGAAFGPDVTMTSASTGNGVIVEGGVIRGGGGVVGGGGGGAVSSGGGAPPPPPYPM